MRVYIENHGCTNNQHLGEQLEGMLVSRGLEITGDPENAQVIVLNTCTVKAKTERRMLRRIRELRNNKGDRQLIIAGCMPTLQTNLISKIAPDSMCFGTYDYDRIPDALLGRNIQSTNHFTPMHRPGIGIVALSTGCRGRCTFCMVRLIKGELRSFPPDKIIEKILRYRERGAHEIWLTSQDLANYGNDGGTPLLPQLLTSILEVAGEMKIRLGMMNPVSVIPILGQLLEIFADERVYKFAHIPVQSGSDAVLSDMGRQYKVEDWIEILRCLRHRFPHFTISTDVIVGFPSEDEDDFQSTLSLLEKSRPDIVNLSRYEHRPGTPASQMKSLQGSEVKRRSRKTSRTIAKITREVNGGWIGWSGRVLVSERGSRGGIIARNDFYKPILIGAGGRLGSRINIRITEANENYLIGSEVYQS